MRKCISLTVFVATLVCAASAAAQVTVLSHATVIDGTGAGAQHDFVIVIEGGRIREMGPASSIATPPGAAVIDLTGKFIVPGIINAHGHVGANPTRSICASCPRPAYGSRWAQTAEATPRVSSSRIFSSTGKWN